MGVARQDLIRAENGAILFHDNPKRWPKCDRECSTKREILQHKLPTATTKANESSEPELKQVVHESGS